MRIVATVTNSHGAHGVHVATDDTPHSLTIAPKLTGFGSSVNGGELLSGRGECIAGRNRSRRRDPEYASPKVSRAFYNEYLTRLGIYDSR